MFRMYEFFRTLLPKGAFWFPVLNGYYDLLLQGIGDNLEEVYDFLKNLAFIRNPYLTPYLSDLEREYGILTDTQISEVDRRNILAGIVYASPGTGGVSDLQDALHRAGFTNLFVYQNDPYVDPRRFIGDRFICVAGNATSVAGNANAIAGVRGGGYLLVNQSSFTLANVWNVVAGGNIAFAGNPNAIAGGSNGFQSVLTDFEIPDNPERWNYVFFVGGLASRWETFKDWDMNKPYTDDWTPETYAVLSKDLTKFVSQPRSLKVIANNNPDISNASSHDPDIAAHWRLEDPGNTLVRDLFGNFFGNNFGANNVFSVLGKGFSFNGTSDYVTAGNAADYTDNFTITCIIDNSSGGTLFSRQAASSQFRLNVNTGTGVLEFIDSTAGVVASGTTNLNTGASFFVGVSIDGANSQLYVNGIAEGSTFNPSITSIIVLAEIGGYNAGTAGLFTGDIFHPKVYNAPKNAAWHLNEYNFFILSTQAAFIDYRQSSISDGDMEETNIDNWESVNGAIVSKQTGSPLNQSQVLRVQYNGTPIPIALQDTHSTLNDTYRIRGVARSDGTSIPIVGYNVTTVWTGTNSTSWQYFDIVIQSTFVSNNILLGMTAAGTGYVEFDQVSIHETPVSGESDISDLIGNYDGIYTNAISKYSPYGKYFELDGVNYLDGELAGELYSFQFSLMAWVRTTNKGGSIISRKNAISTQWDFGINTSGQLYYDNGTTIYNANTDITDGKFHNVVVVILGPACQFYVDNTPDGAHFTSGTVSIINLMHTQIGYQFSGDIAIPRLFENALTINEVDTIYNSDESVTLQGPYAEQILDEPITDSRPISGYFWGDGNGAIPMVFIQLLDDTWEFIAGGIDSTEIQNFEYIAVNGFKGIRLYTKFSTNGNTNFDDIKIFDPIIEQAQVLNEQREQLERIILKQKPLHSWCGLVVEYI